MKRVRFSSFGDPSVLECIEEPDPLPGPGEVRIAVIAAGVNPADVVYLNGRYGVRPRLPATPGLEAAGVVDAIGDGVDSHLIGNRITLVPGRFGGDGAWRTRICLPADDALPTPPSLGDTEAGSCWIAGLSAWAMLNTLDLEAGDSVLISGAGGAVGRLLAQLCRLRSVEAVGIVRDPESAADAGFAALMIGDHRLKSAVSGFQSRAGIDAVGGSVGAAMFESLAAGGTLISYGALSGQPIAIDAAAAIFGERTLRGFWLHRWLRDHPDLADVAVADLWRLFDDGQLRVAIDRTYPFEEAAAACRHLRAPGRRGKTVLVNGTPEG